ncbi:MAG: 50S ribosomal protein L10 [Tepidisphaeraceae bacterium]|jgi:large subunit ribosomal protein L10
MSKYVKNLIIKDITHRFAEIDGVAVINPRGIDATKNNGIRRRLRAKGVRMTVVKNSLARRALGESKIKGFESLLDGPSAVIYGKASISTIARLLLDEKKTDDKIELRGIFFDGEVYQGEAGIKKVSTFPTREEGIGNIVALTLSPGRNLGGILNGQAGKIGSLIKAVEEAAKAKEAAVPAAPAAEAAPAAV